MAMKVVVVPMKERIDHKKGHDEKLFSQPQKNPKQHEKMCKQDLESVLNHLKRIFNEPTQ